MSRILTDTAATALWHQLIREAEHNGAAPLDDEAESYLVFLLMRHLRDAELGGRVFALDYLEALHDAPTPREQRLRDVGDRCLLIAGLYPHQAQRRLVGLDYFLALGAQAYADIAGKASNAWAELYRRLAASFARLVRVLVEVRRLGSGIDAIGALDRHALCLADPTGAAQEFPGAIVIAGGSAMH
ncbi:MAG TPA: hypothetical protein VLF18_06905 [Tahibacter sp.]|uniref:hypothetical protein n=1 Tax=Tahibacter sp. TaxID=2056211 RepID=UPI002C82122A|nr:hypothetical protein [Tahibacter sp.]HSX59910.1 hypothetical protein [Tahibacter sp.]